MHLSENILEILRTDTRNGFSRWLQPSDSRGMNMVAHDPTGSAVNEGAYVGGEPIFALFLDCHRLDGGNTVHCRTPDKMTTGRFFENSGLMESSVQEHQ